MIDSIGMNQAALARPTHSAQHPMNAAQSGEQAARGGRTGQATHAQPASQAQVHSQGPTHMQATDQTNGQSTGTSSSPHVAQPPSTTHAPSAQEAAFSPQGINPVAPMRATAMPLAGDQVNGAPQGNDAPPMDPDPDHGADMGQTLMPDGSVQSNSNGYLGSHFDLQA